MPKSQLVELYAHGLGVIDDVRLEFGKGFNVLTGETGAGKTLLLGALDLCLGGDGSATRYAATTDLRAAAVFTRDDGTEVVLSREAGASGRLRCSLDGVPSSAEALRTLADDLIVIHGQHDSLSLRNKSEVLRIIDASAGISTAELDRTRRQLAQARRLREESGGDERHRIRELEFLVYQVAELEGTAISSEGELEEVLEELTRISELRDGQRALAGVLNQLDGEDDGSALTAFARAIDQLPRGSAYDPARTTLLGALDQAREGVHELTRLSDPDAVDEGVINDLEDRATVLQSIARKYGGSIPEALRTLERLRDEHAALLESGQRLRNLDTDIEELEEREIALAREALRERDFAATRLTDAVRQQLPRVALAHASLRFTVGGDDGSDAQVLFTPNPGLSEGPLQALASGGELSRVLLALSLETAHEDIVAVFDEIDAGIGGQVAQQIGDCLRELGTHQQVLAVTHLASVAAKAEHHLVVEKSVEGASTVTTVRELTGEQRVFEIARMLAGNDLTSESIALAERLLETSR
ncbi:MAG TPA: AAA family ATPase [Acidimicrobiales bacterium]|nr:AAA family ATPase [Acidimicrobiales bacterium]